MVGLKSIISLLACCFTVAAWTTKLENSGEVLARRTYFYVGGQYETVTQPIFGKGQISVGQIYVEKLVPPKPNKPYPLVFIPGAGQTSTNFLNTPDDREGWASYFLSQGYTVYLTDVPQRGRSPWAPTSPGSVEAVPVDYVQKYFTTSEKFAPDEWPQSRLHTQFPGTGLVGDPIFDEFYASQVQLQTSAQISEVNAKTAYNALLDKIAKPVVLVTHSQSGPYGWVAADSKPHLVKGIIAVEPEGPPFVNETGPTGPERVYGVTRLPVEYSPPVKSASELKTVREPPPKDKEGLYTSCTLLAEPRKLVNLAHVKTLLVTGEASYHAPYDYCTIAFLKQTGVPVTWFDLGSMGLHGNGHFAFLEKNNAKVAKLVAGWLEGVK